MWDFDVSAGNGYGKSARLPGWMLNDRHWVERLYGDSAFVEWLIGRWRSLQAHGLAEWLVGRVDAHARTLRLAQARNVQRWRVLGRPVWPSTAWRPTYQAEVAFLRAWLTRRAAWIDASIKRLRPPS